MDWFGEDGPMVLKLTAIIGVVAVICTGAKECNSYCQLRDRTSLAKEHEENELKLTRDRERLPPQCYINSRILDQTCHFHKVCEGNPATDFEWYGACAPTPDEPARHRPSP